MFERVCRIAAVLTGSVLMLLALGAGTIAVSLGRRWWAAEQDLAGILVGIGNVYVPAGQVVAASAAMSAVMGGVGLTVLLYGLAWRRDL